jgi:hypothetical protein
VVCPKKKPPDFWGGDGYFARKGIAKLRRGLGWYRYALWRLRAVLEGISPLLAGFSYLCAMATLQVGSVAAKAAWRSVPVCGRRKMKLQTPKNPVGHE